MITSARLLLAREAVLIGELNWKAYIAMHARMCHVLCLFVSAICLPITIMRGSPVLNQRDIRKQGNGHSNGKKIARTGWQI